MTSSAALRFLAILSLFLAGACARGERARSSVSIDTVAGVVHVRNSGEVAEWRLEPLVTIGTQDGPASFGQVRAIIADEDGQIYVADSKASEIRVFDERGAHARTIGRRGAGPAEFEILYSIGWIGDTIAVLDPGNARIGLMSRTGDWLGQLRHDRLTGSRLYLYQLGDSLYWNGARRGGDGPTLESVFLRYSEGKLDTIPAPKPAPSPSPTSIVCPHPTGGGISFFSNPYASRPASVPAPGGRFAAVPSTSYAVAILDAAGDTVRVVEKAYDPVPITDAEWDEATAPYRDWMSKAPGAKCNPVEFTRPASKTAIGGVFHDDGGRMWVEAVAPNGFTFDVFDRDGRQVASMAAPERQRSVPPAFRGDRVYLVVADSLDVQSVAVFGIRR